MSERVPVAGPSITELEIELVTEAVTHAWYGRAGEFHERFERAFADHVGRRFAVALPSCTSALHLALAALGVGPGDEVIVPELTWIATAAPIDYLGATPIFADVEPGSACLSAESVEARLSPRTRAVIAVDLYGAMPDYEALLTLTRARGVALLEDAAQAIGSTYREKPAGAFGVAAAFSFHGSKTLTTGEGGMLVLDDEALHRRVLALRDHGRDPGDRAFVNREVAFKYKMSAMQAALGLAQLRRLEALVEGKRAILRWYRERLAELEAPPLHLTLNEGGPGVESCPWMTTARWSPAWGLERGLDKVALGELLLAEGVDTRPMFYPLSSLPAYAGRPEAEEARARNRVAYGIAPYGINLPSALACREPDIDRVCQALRRALRRALDER